MGEPSAADLSIPGRRSLRPVSGIGAAFAGIIAGAPDVSSPGQKAIPGWSMRCDTFHDECRVAHLLRQTLEQPGRTMF